METVEEPDAKLAIRLFGDACVQYNGEAVVDFESARLRTLLALTIVHRSAPISRAKAAFTLWPDSTETQARTNLRQLIYDLKAALPDHERFIAIDRASIAWCPVDENATFVDIAVVDAAERAEDLATARAAAAAYTGDLLPDCWDDWILPERARLRSIACGALRRISTQSRDDEAIDAARRLVEIEPIDERAVRQLMTLYAKAGDRAQALAAYKKFAAQLDVDFGVEPDPETLAHYETLTAKRMATTPNAANAFTNPSGLGSEPATAAAKKRLRAESVDRRSVFVGRERPMKPALDVWASAAAGCAGVLLVAGEAGIGKTRLLEELLAVCVSDAAESAVARCYSAEGGLAWSPVVDWLRSDVIKGRLDHLDACQISEISRLLPERRNDQADPIVALESDRRLLYEALADVFAVQAPTLLVLDDIQWCDTETLHFLRYLIRAAGDAPLLVACSVRTESLDDSPGVVELLGALEREDVLCRIDLDPLEPEDVATLVAAAGGELDAELVFRETEGNPLFITEILSAAGNRSEFGPLPPRVQNVIRGRLDDLSLAARTAVEIAATFGRSFSIAELTLAGAGDDDTVADACDELWRRRVIVESGSAFDFSHDKIREVAYSGIGPAQLRRRHRNVAEAIVGLRGDSGAAASQVAAHFEAADMAPEAIAALRRAAAHSVTLYAPDDGIAALRRSLQLLERTTTGRDRDMLELEILTELGALYATRIGYGGTDTSALYRRTAELSRRVNTELRPPTLRGLALEAIAECRLATSIDLGYELIACDDDAAVVEGDYVLGVSRFWRGDFARSRKHLQLALDRYRSDLTATHLSLYGQDPRIVCLARLAVTLHYMNEPTALETMREALDAARELGHQPSTGYALSYACWLAADLSELELLAEWLTEGGRIWNRSMVFFQPMADLMEGRMLLATGDSFGLDRIETGAEKYRAPELRLHLTYALSLLAWARLVCGDAQGAHAAALEGLRIVAATEQCYIERALTVIADAATNSQNYAGELVSSATLNLTQPEQGFLSQGTIRERSA